MLGTITPEVAKLIDGVIAREGGYVDHPNDPGGPTRFGITQDIARASSYNGPIRDLPREVAFQIYVERYYVGPGIHRVYGISPRLGEELLDTAVNMGPGIAAGFFQRALNGLNRRGRDYPDIVVDKRIGPATIGALLGLQRARGANAEVVLMRLVEGFQATRYVEICEAKPTSEDFLFGWILNRIGNVKGQ